MVPNERPPILVVDDDPSAMKYVVTLLKKDGFTAIESTNGYAAYSFLDKQLQTKGHPGVAGVISDWKMPGWDGLKLLAEIRSHQALTLLPFILMSGAVTRPELEIAAHNKANGILVKPFDREQLLTRVNAAFFPPKKPA